MSCYVCDGTFAEVMVGVDHRRARNFSGVTMSDLPPRPTLPPHVTAQYPNLAATRPLTRQQTEMLVDGLIQSLKQNPRLTLNVHTDKDQHGYTIRIQLPQ